ncbi:MAG: hypothetical protein WD069_18995 [Planctomycetales bacterium]
MLVAAVELTGGDCKKTFTMEDLAVTAWKKNKSAWGLRNYEDDYPDADKVRKELTSRGSDQKGLADMGFLDRVGPQLYRLTPAGLATAAALEPANEISQERAGRELEAAVRRILEHPVFKDWLRDPQRPKYFRDGGYFWGIAPGTPPKVVRERVRGVDETLKAAMALLDSRKVDEIVAQRGRVVFDRNDVERCQQFQAILKQRFARDLRILDPQIQLEAV